MIGMLWLQLRSLRSYQRVLVELETSIIFYFYFIWGILKLLLTLSHDFLKLLIQSKSIIIDLVRYLDNSHPSFSITLNCSNSYLITLWVRISFKILLGTLRLACIRVSFFIYKIINFITETFFSFKCFRIINWLEILLLRFFRRFLLFY